LQEEIQYEGMGLLDFIEEKGVPQTADGFPNNHFFCFLSRFDLEISENFRTNFNVSIGTKDRFSEL
jgi:hypothetical protein